MLDADAALQCLDAAATSFAANLQLLKNIDASLSPQQRSAVAAAVLRASQAASGAGAARGLARAQHGGGDGAPLLGRQRRVDVLEQLQVRREARRRGVEALQRRIGVEHGLFTWG